MYLSSAYRRIMTAAAVALALPVGLALAGAAPGDYAGKTEAEITASLQQQGYEVRKIETEDGYLEAYARKDGKRFEIYVDPTSGKVAKIEED